MKRISLLCLVAAVLGALSLVNGQSVSKCFRSEWLQGERSVKLTINGSKVSGAFVVSGIDEPDKKYEFTGTRRGNTLTVAFAGNKLPDVAPSELKSLVWTLVPGRAGELLRLKFYGKRYDTNKYQTSFSDFESCEPSYAALARTAQTIHFAKSANSGTVRLESLAEFQTMKAPATFLIGAVKGQVLEIRADGCSIQLYLPDKKLFEYVESVDNGKKFMGTTLLDRMSTEQLPQTGTYLVVLRKAAENMRPGTVTFKITD
jgi:hypothetical protein